MPIAQLGMTTGMANQISPDSPRDFFRIQGQGARILNGEEIGSTVVLGEKVRLNLLNRLPNRSETMKRCPAVSRPATR